MDPCLSFCCSPSPVGGEETKWFEKWHVCSIGEKDEIVAGNGGRATALSKRYLRPQIMLLNLRTGWHGYRGPALIRVRVMFQKIGGV